MLDVITKFHEKFNRLCFYFPRIALKVSEPYCIGGRLMSRGNGKLCEALRDIYKGKVRQYKFDFQYEEGRREWLMLELYRADEASMRGERGRVWEEELEERGVGEWEDCDEWEGGGAKPIRFRKDYDGDG